MYKVVLKPILFSLDPEVAHNVTTGMYNFLHSISVFRWVIEKTWGIPKGLREREVWGINFKSPVGLAAGFDKGATLYKTFPSLGFGFIEVGTVTPLPQAGNEKPRLFRLPKDKALINRMGFNNPGMVEVAERLKSRPFKVIVGGNIGKNKITKNENASSDYEKCLHTLYPYVDYFVVNVSSPNTPNLRELQEKEPLMHLLKSIQLRIAEKPKKKPLLLKIAPDLSDSQIGEVIEISKSLKLDGLIVNNTTIERKGLKSSESLSKQTGGLSGLPLRERSLDILKYCRKNLGPDFPIISVGGISDASSAVERMEAGATLIQVYSGLIYEGPGLIRQINEALAERNL